MGEIERIVVKKGGSLIVTDPIAAEESNSILKRPNFETLGDV